MTGWVKFHRKLLDSQHGKNLEALGFWTYLLLCASHKDSYCKNGVFIPRGSFKTGRKQIAKNTGLSESKTERLLKKLEIAHQIEQQKTSKYRIITIVNWDKYQLGEQDNEQQVNNKRTTSEQQADTIKNDKNNNNKKNEEEVSNTDQQQIQSDILHITQEHVLQAWELLGNRVTGFSLTRSQLNKLVELNEIMTLEVYQKAVERLKHDSFYLKAEKKSIDMILSEEVLGRTFQNESQIDVRGRLACED